MEVHVNASTGAALRHHDHGPASPKDLQPLDASKITLKQALDAALRHTPSTALEAELGQDAGRSVFAVELLTAAGQRMTLQLSPEDASVLRAKID